MSKQPRLLCALLALAGAAMVLPAAAQFARPDEAVRYRQGAWFILNHHFTRIGAMSRGRIPFDAGVAQRDAEVVAMLAQLPVHAFGAGTDTPADHARPEIWSEPGRFREQNDKLVEQTRKLLAAARTQNLDQIKAAYGATANTCKECHDAYRSH
ncbi:MAG TPA: cytochrome c [Ramlibacter sp.]|nr:cytochrome c [Ramlibacter sp.]